MKVITSIFLFLFLCPCIYAKDNVFSGDLTGNGKKEKIIIRTADKSDLIESLSVISGGKIVFIFKKF